MSSQKQLNCSNASISFGYGLKTPPFPPHRLHTHEWCEIYCVFRGDGHYITEGSRHRLEHGRIFLMRPGEMHMADLIGDEPYENIAFHFSASVVDNIDPQRHLLSPFFDRPLGMNNVYDHSVAAPTEIYSLFRQMCTFGENEYDNCLHVTSLLFSVLDQIKMLFDAKLYNAPSKGSELMHAVVGYVNQNLTLELSPELLCDKFHFSRAQLDRNFKSTTGSTVWAYITAKRLLLAKSYIEDGMRAAEAASACGFKEYSTFYRAYRKQFGCPPSQDRESGEKILAVTRQR